MAQPTLRMLRTPATRKDVAERAGVSTAVVSYVINSGPRPVAPKTRQRVLDAIQVLGYRPNAAARALKLRSTEMIGLVTPDNSNPLFAELSRAIEEAAYELGYALLLTNSGGKPALEKKQLGNLAARQVDGLLLVSENPNPDLTELFDASVPVILMNRADGIDGVSSIGVDFRGAARAGVDHLIGHGHTSIGLVVGLDGIGSSREREEGWREALRSAGLPEGPIARTEFTREGGYEAGKRLLTSANAPSAVFASSDMQAVGVLRAIHEAGLAVPGDVAVVSFDGSPESEFTWPPLTVVQQPVRSMARDAVAALTAKPRQAPAHHVTYQAQLVIRASCGCPG
jgi:LacI family transcriptional regulator